MKRKHLASKIGRLQQKPLRGWIYWRNAVRDSVTKQENGSDLSIEINQAAVLAVAQVVEDDWVDIVMNRVD